MLGALIKVLEVLQALFQVLASRAGTINYCTSTSNCTSNFGLRSLQAYVQTDAALAVAAQQAVQTSRTRMAAAATVDISLGASREQTIDT